MKISRLFEGQKSMCREMLWNAGLVWLTIDRVEVRKCFLPGSNEEKPEKHLVFRGVDAGIVIKGGKLKFLIRELGGNDTAEGAGKQIGLYVDRSYRDRKGSGYGSIQFVVGERHSGKSPPPASKQRPLQPEQISDDAVPPPEAIEGPDESGAEEQE
jgi:hypothetical protein